MSNCGIGERLVSNPKNHQDNYTVDTMTPIELLCIHHSNSLDFNA